MRSSGRATSRRGAVAHALACVLAPAYVLAPTCFLAPAPAHALTGDAHSAVDLDGSLRTIAAALDNYDLDAFFAGDGADFVSQTLLRLTLAGAPRANLVYEIHGVQSFSYATTATGAGDANDPRTSPFGLVPGDTRYRALDAAWDWQESSETVASLWLDRANVRMSVGKLDVTIGRQAITFGKTFFWNPLDVFLPFDPRQFDREYKPGVDAVRVDVATGAFSGFNLVAAAGRTLSAFGTNEGKARAVDASWFGSAALARAFATLSGWDLSVQGGKVYGGYQIGAGTTGEIGPVELRLEATHLWADDSPPLLPGVLPDAEDLVESGAGVVAGAGHRFESSLTIEAEYFFNGLGDTEDLQASLLRYTSGGLLNMSEHLIGASMSYEIMPIVTGQLGAIVAADDPSGQMLPNLTWSAADEIEVLAGAIVNFGRRPREVTGSAPALRSEFGTFPDAYYVEAKIYF